MILGPEIFDKAPPYFIGIALIIWAISFILKSRNEALKERAAALETQVERSQAEHSKLRDDTDAEIAGLRDEIKGLRADLIRTQAEHSDSIQRLQDEYTEDIRKLQDQLLTYQRHSFRLEGILVEHGIEF